MHGARSAWERCKSNQHSMRSWGTGGERQNQSTCERLHVLWDESHHRQTEVQATNCAALLYICVCVYIYRSKNVRICTENLNQVDADLCVLSFSVWNGWSSATLVNTGRMTEISFMLCKLTLQRVMERKKQSSSAMWTKAERHQREIAHSANRLLRSFLFVFVLFLFFLFSFFSFLFCFFVFVFVCLCSDCASFDLF